MAPPPDISAEKGIPDNSRVAIFYSPFSKLARLLIQNTSVHLHSPLHFLVQNLLEKGRKKSWWKRNYSHWPVHMEFGAAHKYIFLFLFIVGGWRGWVKILMYKWTVSTDKYCFIQLLPNLLVLEAPTWMYFVKIPCQTSKSSEIMLSI